MANNQNIDKTKMGIAAAAASAAAGLAAAGYYFYASKNAEHHRKIARKWAKDFKLEVDKQAKKMKAMDKAAVIDVVQTVVDKYSNIKTKIDQRDLAAAAKEIKSNWKALVEEVNGGKKTVAKKVAGVKKTAKKTIKKAVKKVEDMME